jgi:ribonuclease J
MISRGFIFEQKYGSILTEASKELSLVLKKGRFGDMSGTKSAMVKFLEKYFYDRTGRRPVILPVVMEV